MSDIRVENISKIYDKKKALDNVSVTFEKGKIYGLLGRNGAGKSTLIKIMANRVFPSSGRVNIDGLNATENSAVSEILFMMSETSYYPNIKIKKLIKWTKSFYKGFDTQKAEELVKRFNVDPKKRFNKLSTGYKNIVKIIIALSMNCPYIVFDEPVVGLDATHREIFYKCLLTKYEEDNCTFIIATHLIEEVSGLVEHVVLIDDGKIFIDDSIEKVLQMGYSISGKADEISEYIKGKNVLDTEDIAGMKIAYIMGEPQESAISDSMSVTAINLQKLFVKITDRGNGNA